MMGERAMYIEIIEELLHLLSPPGPYFFVLGTCMGILFGILPGLGGPQALTLLLPFTFALDADHSIAMLIGCAGAVAFSGSIPAILINTPGTPANAATCLDGYPLARQGRAGYALGASAVSSALGAIVGIIALILIIPIGRQLVLAFSYAEYFMMAVLGLAVIILVSQESLLKGIIAIVFGLVLSTFGFDPVSGVVRFAFGVSYLYDGIKYISAMIGMFAISEAMELLIRKESSIAKKEEFEASYAGVWEGVKSVFKYFNVFLRSSLIGVLLGIIPGVGGVVTNFIAYVSASKTVKVDNKFGKGDIRGVIAAEAANDSKDGGALVPTLIFGIPGSAVMAVLLGGLTIHGITPGPRLILDHPQIVYALIIALAVSNLLTSAMGLAFFKYLSKITILPTSFISPLVIVLAMIGSYAMYRSVYDTLVALIFGLLGYLFKHFGYSRIGIIIAMILGDLIQLSFFQTIRVYGYIGFFNRPIALGLLLITIFSIWMTFKKKKVSSQAGI